MIIENIDKTDFNEINELLLRNGLSTIDASSSLYKKYEDKNNINFPLGWKLIDSKNKIRGVLFSHITECDIKNESFLACIMSTWAIDHGYRGNNTQKLLDMCMKQKYVDLLIDGTATLPVSKRLLKSGYLELNSSNFKEIFFWVTNYKNFTKFICNKYKIPKMFFVFIYFIFLFPSFFKIKKEKVNVNYQIELSQNIPDNIYDLFRQNKTFSLKKNKQNLNRRIENGLNKKKCSILLVKKNNIIKGCAIIDIHTFQDTRIDKITIFDVFAHNSSEEIIHLIIKNIIYHAKKINCAFVEFYGVPKHMTKIIRKNKPFKRSFKTSPFYIKVLNDRLLQMDEFKNWSPTLIDTDRSLY